MIKTSSLIAPNMLSANLKARDKASAFAEIVRHVARARKLRNEEALLSTLQERESKGTTGIGDGIAIPHARIEGLKEVVFFVGVSREGIDYGAIDGSPVHVVFLFLTPQADTETHLKILSRISGLAGNKSLIRKMIAAQTDKGLYDVLKTEELSWASFISLTEKEIFLELETGQSGLTDEDAGKRLLVYGGNRLKQLGKKSLFRRFLYNFTNQLALLMWVGAVLAFLVGMAEVGWAIIAVIFINAFFSYWQEYRAERAIDALKKLIPSYARCVRGGKEQRVLAEELVPGDIIQLDEGDNIAADARLIEAHDLRVDNSVFSGESKPSYKTSEVFKNGKNFLWTELPNLIFAGTSVVSGNGLAVVIATGMSTEIGQIAYLTQTVKEDISPLQREIGRLTKVITLVAVIMGAAFFFVGTSLAKMSFVAASIFAIGIILGNVPEGLMPTVTMALALGVQRMAKRHALIKKLSSVETLGCTNVICTDKTGTLTTNQMCVRKIWLNGKVIEVEGSGYEPEGEFSCCGSRYLPGASGGDRFDLLMRSGV
ncbi:MAG: HAD-IC family P-type ATPase, partial [Candidatus Krumholzibacteriaceae bacterium]